MRVAVIGSGPSGWAASNTLIALGHDVTVIDTGLIESDLVKNETRTMNSTLNRKLYFGSDLPYRSFPFGPSLTSQKVNPISSFAHGGLSLVWGATMLPYCQEDTNDWPFNISTLEKQFYELSKLIPITGNMDALSDTYGNFYSRRGIIPSDRIVRLLESLNQVVIPRIQVGLSRLAVETGKRDVDGCIYCNKCINGCPSNFIWNSKDLNLGVKKLKLRVIKVLESSSGICIDAVDVNGKHLALESFEKIFLAAGPLESFRILANSKIIGGVGILKDSATFFLPLIVLPRLGKTLHNSFGLSQLFIRLGRSDSHPASKYQLYEYSEDLVARAKKALPLGVIVPNCILKFFLKRMMVAIGYIDGDDSPSIKMNLLEDGSLFSDLNLTGKSYKERDQVIKRSIKRLSVNIRKHGLIPLPFLAQIAVPGEGVHFGSSIPMGNNSDLLGRPVGSKNIHVVDSSVLPSIAPGPMTFTVMANAMRIAEESVK